VLYREATQKLICSLLSKYKFKQFIHKFLALALTKAIITEL